VLIFSIISSNQQDKFALLWRDLTLVEGGIVEIIGLIFVAIFAFLIGWSLAMSELKRVTMAMKEDLKKAFRDGRLNAFEEIQKSLSGPKPGPKPVHTPTSKRWSQPTELPKSLPNSMGTIGGGTIRHRAPNPAD
jgi:hypothetical protein